MSANKLPAINAVQSVCVTAKATDDCVRVVVGSDTGTLHEKGEIVRCIPDTRTAGRSHDDGKCIL